MTKKEINGERDEFGSGEKIRVAICEDAEPLRRHFVNLINRQPNMVLVGQADTAKEILKLVRETQTDVVLMDIQLEYRDAGIDATREMTRMDPNIQVIALTIHEEEEMIVRAYSAGIADYVVKTQSDEKVLAAIESSFHSRDTVIRSDIAGKIIDECVKLRKNQANTLFMLTIVYRLTKSELDLLYLLCEGYTREQIEQRRNVADSTIKTQIHSILTKLEYHSVAEMLDNVRELPLFEIIKPESTE